MGSLKGGRFAPLVISYRPYVRPRGSEPQIDLWFSFSHIERVPNLRTQQLEDSHPGVANPRVILYWGIFPLNGIPARYFAIPVALPSHHCTPGALLDPELSKSGLHFAVGGPRLASRARACTVSSHVTRSILCSMLVHAQVQYDFCTVDVWYECVNEHPC